MQAQPPTYMLLPDFSVAPGDSVHLGTLLSLSKDTKLPDPDLPLNDDDRVPPAEKDIKRNIEEPWKYDSSRQLCWSAGLNADVPVFVPVGGSLGYTTKSTEGIIIESERVRTERFTPSPSYLTQALSTDFIRDYCRKSWFPSVYLVTGLKFAEKTSIETGRRAEHGGHVKASVDATALGVPLKAGPLAEVSNASAKKTATYMERPFLMAYQLKRLKLKANGSLRTSENFNKYALFDDEELAPDSAGIASLESWDIHDVEPSTVHDA